MAGSLRETAVVFSGGTDSTCAAALAAEQHDRVHLLTYWEIATAKTIAPSRNIDKLRERFTAVEFVAHFLPVDPLVRHFSYDRYWSTFRRHKALVLATPGYSSLSWHTRTILYCLEHKLTSVSDGLTRELMHFPGHMTEVIELFRELYRSFGIEYTNPVRDWDVPPDRKSTRLNSSHMSESRMPSSA